MKHRFNSLFTQPAITAACLSLGFLALYQIANAADKYWDTSTAITPGRFQAGDGAWTDTKWGASTNGNVLTTFASGDAALFGARGDSSVTVSGTQNIGAGSGLFIGDIDGAVGASSVTSDTSMSLSLSGGSLALAGNMAVRGHRATGFAGASVLNLNGTNITGNGVDSSLRIQNGGTSASSLTTAAINQSAGNVSMTSMTMGNYGSGASYTITGGNLTLTGTVNMMNAATPIGASTINLNGGVFTTSQITATNGTSGARQSNLNFGGGTLRAVADQATFLGANLNTVTINAGGATIDDGGFVIGINKAIGGVGALTKQGGGTLTLDNTHSYNGATNVTQGTLVLNGNISTSTLTTVSNGATLSGTGTAGATTLDGTLAMGSSPAAVGTMNFSILSLTSTSTYSYGLTGGGTTADLAEIGGALTINTAAILDLVQLGAYTLGNKFTLFAYDGALTGNFSTLADEATFTDAGGLWKIDYNDTTAGLNGGVSASNTYVTVTAIPEPTVALLGSLGLLMLLRRRVR